MMTLADVNAQFAPHAILVNISGGKDSMALLASQVKEAKALGIKHKLIAVHCDLGRMEWEGTLELAQEHAAVFDIPFHTVRRELGDILEQVLDRFDRKISKTGKSMAPYWMSSQNRFCTSDQKTSQVAKLVVQLHDAFKVENDGEFRVVNMLGIRAAESSARTKMSPWKVNKKMTTKTRTTMDFYPIFDWTFDQVWANIDASGLRVHRAYSLGMSRLSCAFCMMASKRDLLIAAKANPELLEDFIQVEETVGYTMVDGRSMKDLKAEAQADGLMDIEDAPEASTEDDTATIEDDATPDQGENTMAADDSTEQFEEMLRKFNAPAGTVPRSSKPSLKMPEIQNPAVECDTCHGTGIADFSSHTNPWEDGSECSICHGAGTVAGDHALVVHYGGGVDSTAILVEMVNRGERPDYILFADTQAEKPETYDYIRGFSQWLVLQGFPAITVVTRFGGPGNDKGSIIDSQAGPCYVTHAEKTRESHTGPGYTNLEGKTHQNKWMPSPAYGGHSCAAVFKVEPQDRYLAQVCGLKSTTDYIGFDATEGKRKSKKSFYAPAESKRPAPNYEFPLIEWGWDRAKCIEVIEAAGLRAPMKSACFFCPMSKKHEIRWLAINHPDLFQRALAMEDVDMIESGREHKSVKGMGPHGSFNWRRFAQEEGLMAIEAAA
tara:strand:+ start:447 stop:2435 length:1989 start_codon:yes stop_codon:yes gene_type:complete